MNELREAANKLSEMANPAEPTPEVEEAPEVSEAPEPQETSEPEEVTPEVSEDTDGEREEDAEPTAESESIEADQFAELLGLDPNKLVVDDKGVRFKAIVDGEESDANLGDLLERYQRDAHLTNRSKAVAESQKKADEMVNQLATAANEMAQQQNALMETLEREFLAPFEGVDWNGLRTEDPAEYAVRRNDLRDAQTRFKELKQQAQESAQQRYAEAAQLAESRMGEYLEAQKQLIAEKIPTWSETTQKDITTFLKGEGFDDSEIGQIMDARMVKVAHDAMLYRKGATAVTKKISKTIPKVIKPSSQPQKGAINLKAEKEARNRLKTSGSMADAAALLRMKYGKE